MPGIQRRIMEIRPPLGGVSKAIGYQNQPPFTSVKCVNFLPFDYRDRRAVLTNRPPFTTSSAPNDGDVNFLSRVNFVSGGSTKQHIIQAAGGKLYYGTSRSDWNAAGGAANESVHTTGPIFGVPYLQKVYIGNPGGKPIVYDAPNQTAALLSESAGTVPDGLRYFAVFKGALWGAGADATPHVLYASRTGDATDWDISVASTDLGGAYYTGGDDEGLLRGDITALWVHTDDVMIVGTQEGLVAVRGHPRRGGVIEDISDSRCLGQGAWCRDDQGASYFMSDHGMMRIPPGANTIVQPISTRAIPDELRAISYSRTDEKIAMAYDPVWQGIFITIRDDSGLTNGSAWFFDTNSGGFFELTFGKYPYTIMSFPPGGNADRGFLVFGSDGGNYGFDDPGAVGAISYTDGEFRTAPIKLGQNVLTKGAVLTAFMNYGGGVYDTDIAMGTVKFYPGVDGHDAATTTKVAYSAKIEDIIKNGGRFRPRVAANSITIGVEFSESTKTLTFDGMTLEVAPAGKNRAARP